VQPLGSARLAALVARIAGLLAPGGLCLVANHYFFRADAESRRSRMIHDAFATCPALRPVSGHRRAFYIADLFAAA
jgi:hypothetical protein